MKNALEILAERAKRNPEIQKEYDKLKLIEAKKIMKKQNGVSSCLLMNKMKITRSDARNIIERLSKEYEHLIKR
jgi:hypothetical protein